MADFDNQLKHCEHLGKSVALAALRAEKEGIREPSNQEITQKYMAYKWDPIYEYINNLTQGTFDWSTSLPNKALAGKELDENERDLERPVQIKKRIKAFQEKTERST